MIWFYFFFVFAGVPGKVRWKPPGNHQLPHGKPALHSSAYSSMISPRLTFKSLARVQYSLQNNTEGQNWAGTPCGFLLSHIVKICLCDCQSERRSHLKAAEDEKDSWRRLFQSSFRPASLNSESDESSTFQNKNPVFVLPLFCYVKVTVSFLRGFDVVTFPSLFQRGRALDLKTAAEHAERERERQGWTVFIDYISRMDAYMDRCGHRRRVVVLFVPLSGVRLEEKVPHMCGRYIDVFPKTTLSNICSFFVPFPKCNPNPPPQL